MESMIIPPGLDISADLTELGRTPIAVVSAGVKSILDIGRTLEFLVRILRIMLSLYNGRSDTVFPKRVSQNMYKQSFMCHIGPICV